MGKHHALTKKNIIITGTVIAAVLVAVLSGAMVHFVTSDRGDPPEIEELKRLCDCELSAIKDRDSAYADAFAEAGGDAEEYEPMDASVDLDILYASEKVLSVVITTDSEDASPFGREKYYNIHRGTGKHLSLVDVMGYDYRRKVKEALLPQVGSDRDVYEGIDVVPMINEDRMFYLADGGRAVVIVFDAGEIAPDKLGVKRYKIACDTCVA